MPATLKISYKAGFIRNTYLLLYLFWAIFRDSSQKTFRFFFRLFSLAKTYLYILLSTNNVFKLPFRKIINEPRVNINFSTMVNSLLTKLKQIKQLSYATLVSFSVHVYDI